MISSQLRHGMPRLVEVFLAVVGLILVSPLIVIAGIAVALTSRGPAIFRQPRVGRGGRMFTLFKLRSMRPGNDGPEVTGSQDERITFVGRILRKTKIDELPELWNVVRGDMALVGPRPEVLRYVDLSSAKWQVILQARPGITDPVTMRLRNEEELLGTVGENPERFYLDVLQPLKLDGYVDYLQERSWRFDLEVLWWTVLAVILPSIQPTPTLSDLSTRGLGQLHFQNSLSALGGNSKGVPRDSATLTKVRRIARIRWPQAVRSEPVYPSALKDAHLLGANNLSLLSERTMAEDPADPAVNGHGTMVADNLLLNNPRRPMTLRAKL